MKVLTDINYKYVAYMGCVLRVEEWVNFIALSSIDNKLVMFEKQPKWYPREAGGDGNGSWSSEDGCMSFHDARVDPEGLKPEDSCIWVQFRRMNGMIDRIERWDSDIPRLEISIDRVVLKKGYVHSWFKSSCNNVAKLHTKRALKRAFAQWLDRSLNESFDVVNGKKFLTTQPKRNPLTEGIMRNQIKGQGKSERPSSPPPPTSSS